MQYENCSPDVHWLKYRTQGKSKTNMKTEDGLKIVQYGTNGGSVAYLGQIIIRADSTVKGHWTSIYLQPNMLKISTITISIHTQHKKLLETVIYNKVWYHGQIHLSSMLLTINGHRTQPLVMGLRSN
jgi:hypothetical protein